jgi:cell division septum initiation protein DivIVA
MSLFRFSAAQASGDLKSGNEPNQCNKSFSLLPAQSEAVILYHVLVLEPVMKHVCLLAHFGKKNPNSSSASTIHVASVKLQLVAGTSSSVARQLRSAARSQWQQCGLQRIGYAARATTTLQAGVTGY